MTSITHTAPAAPAFPVPSFSFATLIGAIFSIELREKLSAASTTAGDDAAFAWGM